MIKLVGCITFGAVAIAAYAGYQTNQRAKQTTAWWENECVRTDLVHELEVKNFRLSKMDTGFDPGRLDQARKEKAALEAKIHELEQARRGLAASVKATEQEMVSYHDRYLNSLRALAIGKHWPQFSCGEGRVFQDVKIVSVNAAGVTIRHSNGSARIGYGELSQAQREEFGIEEKSALAASYEEQKRVAAYDEWTKRELQRQEFERPPEPKYEAFAEVVKAPPTRLVAEAPKRKLETGLLSAAPRMVGTGNRIYRGSRSRYYVNYYYGGYDSRPAFSGAAYRPSFSSPQQPSQPFTPPSVGNGCNVPTAPVQPPAITP